MKLVLNKKTFITLTLIFSFFTNLALPILIWAMPVSLIFLYLTLSLLFFKNYEDIIIFIKQYITDRNSLFRPFMLFIFLIVITSVFFIITGKVAIKYNIFPFVGGIIMQMFAGMFFAAYISFKELIPKKIVKILYGMLYAILIIGVFDFIICLFNITPLIDAIQWFATDRMFMGDGEGSIERSYVGNLARIESVYVEPATFACVISFFLPMIYTLTLSKFQIFSNATVNNLVKKTIIPLTWFNLIFTQSPIYLVIGLLITFFYFHNYILKYIKELLVMFIITIIFFSLYIGASGVDLSDTYLQRIFTVFETFGNFDLFVTREASLATRIINYYNTLCVWLQHPIFGVGLGALCDHMEKQTLYSNIPLTPEIIMNYGKAIRFSFNTGFFYKYIAETGIVGITLIYYFILNIVNKLNKVAKQLPACLEKDFCKALTCTLITFCALSFYNIGYLSLYIWIIVGISIGMYYRLTKNAIIKIKRNSRGEL